MLDSIYWMQSRPPCICMVFPEMLDMVLTELLPSGLWRSTTLGQQAISVTLVWCSKAYNLKNTSNQLKHRKSVGALYIRNITIWHISKSKCELNVLRRPRCSWLIIFFSQQPNNLEFRLHFLEVSKLYEPFTLTERLDLERNKICKSMLC